MTSLPNKKQESLSKEEIGIYLAHDCFTSGQIKQALYIDDMIMKNVSSSKDVSIYNPSKFEFNDKQNSDYVSGYEILMSDYNAVNASDLIILCLDTNDEGVVAEGALAWKAGIPVFILLTDSRFTNYNGSSSMDNKYEMMKEDIYNNDFQYFNKLVSGMAYGNVYGHRYGVNHDAIHRPLIFNSEDELVEKVAEYINTYEVH